MINGTDPKASGDHWAITNLIKAPHAIKTNEVCKYNVKSCAKIESGIFKICGAK